MGFSSALLTVVKYGALMGTSSLILYGYSPAVARQHGTRGGFEN